MSNNEGTPRYRYVSEDKATSEGAGALESNEISRSDDLQERKLRLIDRWAVTRMLGISLDQRGAGCMRYSKASRVYLLQVCALRSVTGM